MKVRDVMALAAANLGREDLVALVNGCGGEAEELSALLRCYNLIENEVALDYFPLQGQDDVGIIDGTVSYASLSHAPVTILSVTAGGRALAFEALPAQLCVASPRCGRATVRYTYSPAEKEIGDDCEFSAKISARLLSFGIACEFCLSRGQFSEAATWEKKYRDALLAANICRKRLSVRSRRWR